MRKFLVHSSVSFLALAAVACSSSGGTPSGDDSGSSSGGNLSFATDVYPILSTTCTVCHVSTYPGGAAGALDMSGGASATLALLVNKAPAGLDAGSNAGACATAGLASTIKLVVPSDSAHSLLYNKVASAETGGPTVLCGVPMPQGSMLMPASQVTTIKNWIDDGAKP